MIPRVGCLVHDGGLTITVTDGRDHIETRTLEVNESLAGVLKALMDAHARWAGRVRLGLDRSLVTVKLLELPRTASAELVQMVSFELERHLPFPADDAVSAFRPLSRGEGAARVLVAACERRVIEGPLSLLDAAGRKPMAISVACHDLSTLVPRAALMKRVVWVHAWRGHLDVLLIADGDVCLSRRVVASDSSELAVEIRRSLPLVGWPDGATLWMSGEGSEAWRMAPGLAELGPVSDPPFARDTARLVATLPSDEQGTTLLALAVALGSRSPALNLLAHDRRPWSLTRGQLVTVGMVVVTGLLGIGLLWAGVVEQQRYLARLSAEIQRLDPEVKAVERMAAEAAGRSKLVGTLRSARTESVRALPVLQDLAQILPTDAWLQSVSMDRQGVELTGQANAAGQLIPLLENSPWLERVEFTSPVTRGQDKEQFRIKAAWERPASAGSAR
jgi:Tfp pilus assembly protein PilN